ncbi:MAG: hypothetical protein AAFX53_15360 [Bacteroidota bacterium]
MKNIGTILLSFTLCLWSSSCEDDGGASKIILEDGAAPNMIKSANAPAFIDLIQVENGETVNLSFSADVAQGNPAVTDIVGVYTTVAGPVYKTTLFGDVSLPQDFSLSSEEIISVFPELNSVNDFEVGDILTITTRFTMDDGRVLEIVNDDGSSNTGTNIQTTVLFSTVINYPVTCPSDLSGIYTAVSSAVGVGGGAGVPPIEDREYTVTVTDNGGGSYSISDYSGGIYDGLFCVPFSVCGDLSSGTITDICGELNGSAPDCCSSTITFEGTVLANGDWEVSISSGLVTGTAIWIKQ